MDTLNLAMDEEESDETRAFLPAADAELSKTSEKPQRKKVQWIDSGGDNKLAQVLEFVPSDASDSEEEDDSCICTIM